MLSFKSFILSLDESFKDILQQKPHLKQHLIQYKSALESSGHKYSDHMIRYLIKEHEAGRLTPDHPDLHQTLSTLKTHLSHHGIKDPTSLKFDELHKSLKPFFNTSSSKKARAEEERKLINTDKESGFNTYHITSKEASQHFYGGGENGPAKYGTSWCVSARSANCQFNKKYGSMYTIHHKDPKTGQERWWAYHPEQHIITSQKNDGEKPADDFIKNNPNFKKSIDAAKQHWKSNKEQREAESSKYDKYLKEQNPIKLMPIVVGLSHQDRDIKQRHIDKIVNLQDENFAKSILDSKHPAITTNHIHNIASNFGHLFLDKDTNTDFIHNHFKNMSHDQINELLNNKKSVLYHTKIFNKSLKI
jgi:hypothetical protein